MALSNSNIFISSYKFYETTLSGKNKIYCKKTSTFRNLKLKLLFNLMNTFYKLQNRQTKLH